jgi:membrane protease YdiL (CAAX protease family)
MAIYRLSRLPELTTVGLRAGAAVALVLGLLASGRAARSDFGLVFRGWRDDLRWIGHVAAIVLTITLTFGLAFVVACRAGWLNLRATDTMRNFRDTDEFRRYLVMGLICYPLVEELVYRGLAVPALAALAGNWGAIVLSGPLFYLLHIVVYGYPAFLVHYCVAGWILAWAFVYRGRLWVPVVLHAAGNAMVGVGDALLLFMPDFVQWLVGTP